MSFDPITLAMAKPKAIDLDKYGIGEVVLGLFASGGGRYEMADNNGFWDAVNTDKQLRFVIDASAMGAVVKADVTCYTSGTDGTPALVEASFMVDYDGLHKVTIVIGNNGGIVISVIVEPLTT